MDEQATLKTYGNTNLPEGTEDRPLVTFALFSYNQEQYIREAVEGVFSQTYSPLEIILSDDCSSDRTYQIMQEMAREYRGPHLVKVRRNPANQGTAQHFSSTAFSMRGAMLVVGAGDDISLPERTERLIEFWSTCKKESGLYFSDLISFHDGQLPANGSIQRSNFDENNGTLRQRLLSGMPIFGIFAKSAMYSRDLIDCFPSLFGGSVVEDGPMICRAILSANVRHLSMPLVASRMDGNNSGTGLNLKNPSHWNRLFRSRIMAAFTVMRDIQHIRDLTDEEKSILEARYINQIKNLSNFIIPEIGHISYATRVRMAARFLLGRAYPGFPKTNIAMALRVLGFR